MEGQNRRHGQPDGRCHVTFRLTGRAQRRCRTFGVVAHATGGNAVDCGAGIAADAGYSEYLAAECATFHRSEHSDGTVPPLGATPYPSLVAALKEYRSGVREGAAMRSVARTPGGAGIEALAAYLSGRP